MYCTHLMIFYTLKWFSFCIFHAVFDTTVFSCVSLATATNCGVQIVVLLPNFINGGSILVSLRPKPKLKKIKILRGNNCIL